MMPRPTTSTRTTTLFPDTPLFRSEVGQHSLDRRFPLGDDLVGAIEFEQPDGSESWRDVNVGRLAGESGPRDAVLNDAERSEEHTAELQSLMRNSYAVVCSKKKKAHPRQQSARLSGNDTPEHV